VSCKIYDFIFIFTWCSSLLRSLRIAENGGGYMQRGVAKGLKVPCLFMITEVSIRCQKTPEVGIRRIPAYTPPQYTTGYGVPCMGCFHLFWVVLLCSSSHKKTKIKSSLMDHLTSNSLDYSILTRQLTANITPLKQLFCASTITSSVQWDHRKYRASAYSTSLPLSTLLTMTS